LMMGGKLSRYWSTRGCILFLCPRSDPSL
jgi:hypothetical protein